MHSSLMLAYSSFNVVFPDENIMFMISLLTEVFQFFKDHRECVQIVIQSSKMTRIIAIVRLDNYPHVLCNIFFWVEDCPHDVLFLRIVIRRSAYFFTCEQLVSFKFSFTCRCRTIIDDGDCDVYGLSSFFSSYQNSWVSFLTVTLLVFLSYFCRSFNLSSHQDKYQIRKIRLANDGDRSVIISSSTQIEWYFIVFIDHENDVLTNIYWKKTSSPSTHDHFTQKDLTFWIKQNFSSRKCKSHCDWIEYPFNDVSFKLFLTLSINVAEIFDSRIWCPSSHLEFQNILEKRKSQWLFWFL